MNRALDGNAAAGALAEVFAAEITAAVTACADCGDQRPVGELLTYVEAPGIVLRCAGCGAVQIRLVRSTRRVWLDLRGARVLQFDVEPSSAAEGRDA